MTEEDAAAQKPRGVGSESEPEGHAGKIGAPHDGLPLLPDEEPAPMLEAHAPHKAIHSWADFFIHIATIVIGLVIAVGLEQTVEFLHHRHQRLQLEEQIHGVFEKNVQLIATDTKRLIVFRSFLVEIQRAVLASRRGLSAPAAPASSDLRSALILSVPGIAPYDAAKQNGTVALLSSDRIRIYSRIDSSLGFLRADLVRLDDDMSAVNAFNDRFDATVDGYVFVEIGQLPDLTKLSAVELAEYQAQIAILVNATDNLIGRLGLFDAECRAVLAGVQDDNEFVDLAMSALRSHSKLKGSPLSVN